MDAKLKRRWIEALNSGDYSQTQDHLKDGDGYCCLGVLCDIVAENDENIIPLDVGFEFVNVPLSDFPFDEEAQEFCGDDGYGTTYDHVGQRVEAQAMPPIHLAKRLGIIDFMDKVAGMNDGGDTFEEIADWIDDNISTR
jgi:hypothetical protein